jgi:hypothetical protein
MKEYFLPEFFLLSGGMVPVTCQRQKMASRFKLSEG